MVKESKGVPAAGGPPARLQALQRQVADLERAVAEYEKKNQFFEMEPLN